MLVGGSSVSHDQLLIQIKGVELAGTLPICNKVSIMEGRPHFQLETGIV